MNQNRSQASKCRLKGGKDSDNMNFKTHEERSGNLKNEEKNLSGQWKNMHE